MSHNPIFSVFVVHWCNNRHSARFQASVRDFWKPSPFKQDTCTWKDIIYLPITFSLYRYMYSSLYTFVFTIDYMKRKMFCEMDLCLIFLNDIPTLVKIITQIVTLLPSFAWSRKSIDFLPVKDFVMSHKFCSSSQNSLCHATHIMFFLPARSKGQQDLKFGKTTCGFQTGITML